VFAKSFRRGPGLGEKRGPGRAGRKKFSPGGTSGIGILCSLAEEGGGGGRKPRCWLR